MRFAPSVIALVFLLSGCASAPVIAELEAAPPLWVQSGTPWPLSPIELVPGESVEVDLAHTVLPALSRIDAIRVQPEGIVSTVLNKSSITLSGMEEADGICIVEVDLVTVENENTTVGFPVTVTPKTIVSFLYVPAAEENPSKVCVAGEFNGWNSQSHPMQRTADGFRAEMGIDAGVWNYKFVVDGEWIADPSNPRIDASGFGNSILEVSGSSNPHLDFLPLSTGFVAPDSLGGVIIHSPGNTPVHEHSIQVFWNNMTLMPTEWRYEEERKLLIYQPDSEAVLPENNLVVSALDAEGVHGTFQTRVSARDAGRSPRDEVLYYAVTDRFRNGDQNNDPALFHEDLHHLANYKGGDFAGLYHALKDGYFDELGVTTLWISPVNRNTMNIERDAVPPHRLFTSYHGYWPVSLTDTNPAFGTIEELRAVVEEAHRRGIAVILDYVANHVHEDHPLYRQHPEWATDLELEEGELNIRKFDEHPFTTWFDEFLPTFDYTDNEDLIELMTDNALYWLDETGADGFRHDAVKHIPEEFWIRLTERLTERTRQTGRRYFQVGETISDRGTISRFIGPDLLDGQFDFPLLFSIQNVLAREEGSMVDIADALKRSQSEYPSASVMSPLIGNHDVVRFMGLADGDIPPDVDEKEIGFSDPPVVDHPETWDRIALAYGLLFASQGPPTIYYGDEVGMTGAHDPDNRRAMSWEPLSERQSGLRTLVSTLAGVRQSSSALRRGHLTVLSTTPESLVFIRTGVEETVLVALVRDTETTFFQLPESFGAVSFQQMIDGGLELVSEGRLEGRPRSFGYWRLTPHSADSADD